jgi:hypothetical protein
MTTVKLSNKSPQEASNISDFIQGAIFRVHVLAPRATSKNAIQLKMDESITHAVVITAAPRDPRKRPKSPEAKLPNRGKNIISKYINFVTF